MRAFLAAALALLTVGCTHVQLKQSTLNTSATLTDMQFQQVLDNLAMFSQNPGSLPFFALNSKGNVQISDSLAANGGLNFAPHKFTTSVLGIGPASRAVTENWDLQPILTPNKLLRMRCLYQYAVGRQASDCHECYSIVQSEAGKDRCGVPRFFFSCGGKLDVPKCASYVGRYKGTYVWVMPEQVDALSRFALLVLDIASTNDGLPNAGAAYGAEGLTPFDGTPRLNPYVPSAGGIQFFPNFSTH